MCCWQDSTGVHFAGFLDTENSRTFQKSLLCLQFPEIYYWTYFLFFVFLVNVSVRERCQIENPGDWSLLYSTEKVQQRQQTVQASHTLPHQCALTLNWRVAQSPCPFSPWPLCWDDQQGSSVVVVSVMWTSCLQRAKPRLQINFM